MKWSLEGEKSYRRAKCSITNTTYRMKRRDIQWKGEETTNNTITTTHNNTRTIFKESGRKL